MKSIVLLSGFLLSSVGAFAQTTVFVFSNGFSGLNENPPVVSAATYTVNTLLHDAAGGTNGFGSFTVDISFFDLTTAASNAHIHGPVTSLTQNAGVASGGALAYTAATSGTVTGVWDIPSQALLDDLFAGRLYVNLHSTTYPGGELRGQLAPIPEPSIFALALGALALGGVLWRRRRGS